MLKLDTERMRLVPGTPGQEDGNVEVAHQEGAPDPALAHMLSSLEMPEFPVPLGVLRAIQAPTYEVLTRAQEATQREQFGPGSIDDLLHEGSTWEVS